MNSEVEYLCGLGLSGVAPENERIDYHHDLTCSEVLPGPGQMLDIPGSTSSGQSGPPLRHTAASFSMDSILTSYPLPSHVTSSSQALSTTGPPYPHHHHHHPHPTTPIPPPTKPTLHVEVCQATSSNMRSSRLKELVLAMLREKGTVFGELFIQEFDDPVLSEHIQSIAIADTPSQIKVRERGKGESEIGEGGIGEGGSGMGRVGGSGMGRVRVR